MSMKDENRKDREIMEDLCTKAWKAIDAGLLPLQIRLVDFGEEEFLEEFFKTRLGNGAYFRLTARTSQPTDKDRMMLRYLEKKLRACEIYLVDSVCWEWECNVDVNMTVVRERSREQDAADPPAYMNFKNRILNLEDRFHAYRQADDIPF